LAPHQQYIAAPLEVNSIRAAFAAVGDSDVPSTSPLFWREVTLAGAALR